MTKQDRLVRPDPHNGKVKAAIVLPGGTSEAFHLYATDGYVVVDRSNFDFTNRDAEWALPCRARPVLLVAA